MLDQTTMTPVANRRWLRGLSILVVLATIGSGYCFVRWGYLRVQVALGEEQTQMFEECRTRALEHSRPEKIAGLIHAAIIYYPSGTKQTPGSHLDRMVERSRQIAIREMIAHLRATTGADLGSDPQAWINRFGEKELVQPGGAANGSHPIRSETNRTSSTAGSRR